MKQSELQKEMSLVQDTAELPVPAQPAEAREEIRKLSQSRKQSWPGMSLVSKQPDLKREKKKKKVGKKLREKKKKEK